MGNKNKLILGIIGGGQLAQMLVQNSPFHDLGFCVFTESKNCPAQITSAEIFIGNIKDQNSLKEFFKKIQILTIENEFLDLPFIHEALKNFPKLLCFPTFSSLEIAQNKLTQKYLFEQMEIPTSRFKVFDPNSEDPKEGDLKEWLKKTYHELSHRFVLKWAKGGYDGKGNLVVQSLGDLDQALPFCEKALSQGEGFYAEEFISYEKELAQIYVRNIQDEFINYPLVISKQEDNICRTVYGPAIDFGLSPDIQEATTKMAKAIASQLNFVGTFALEFFYTTDGSVLANEMAPRVHNSGHYTLDAAPANQFENHLRAILGAKLSSPVTYPFFAMRNVLGPKGFPELKGLSSNKNFNRNNDSLSTGNLNHMNPDLENRSSSQYNADPTQESSLPKNQCLNKKVNSLPPTPDGEKSINNKLTFDTIKSFLPKDCILYEESLKQSPDELANLDKEKDLKFYWYFKDQIKPSRKLGHINAIALSKDDIQRKIELMKDVESSFWKAIQKA